MKGCSKTIFALIVVLSMLTVLVPRGYGQAVPDGEPLHLWFRRSPSQDTTTLYFYKPNLTEEKTRDPRYRHVIGPKGSDKLMVWFPVDGMSNFLQFEYNETLTGNYTFHLLGDKSSNPADDKFVCEVRIDFDKDNDGEYDEAVSFDISGPANSKRVLHSGNISIDEDMIQRFDEKNGGRIRITMSRKDDLDTNVLLYCGYNGYHSGLQLPYSKYTYVPAEEEDGGISTGWIIAIGSLIILLVVFIAYFMNKKQEEEPEEEPAAERRRRRR